MYKNNRILAIIPARSGSKGIKNKNIIDLNGKPLIAYTIEEALKSKYIDKMVVSTDSKEISHISKQYGGEVPFIRPEILATDEAKTIDVILHSIVSLEELGEFYDYVILLQPTQPLRRFFHIDESIKLIIDKKEENLVSVSEVQDHPILIREIETDGYLKNILNENSTIRRQNFKKYYKVNGAIYINKINKNLNKSTSLNDNKFPYIMDNKYSLDIDEELDLKIAEMIIQDYIKNYKKEEVVKI